MNRLRMAQIICRRLPPVLAYQVKNRLYPQSAAQADDYDLEVRAQSGSLWKVKTSDHHGHTYSVLGYYDWRVWAITAALCRVGDAIVEVGANVGTETVCFADTVSEVGQVVCFEPLPENFERLQENIRRNQFEQIMAYPYAVGEKNSTLYFSPPRTEYLSGSGHILSQRTGNALEVTCITLNSLADKLCGVRLIHADAEGSEIFILRGATTLLERDQPALLLEVSPRHFARHDLNVHDLVNLLNGYEYRLFTVRHLGLKEVDASCLESNRMSNWLCLHQEQAHLVARVNRYMRRSYLLPCLPGLNPLTRI